MMMTQTNKTVVTNGDQTRTQTNEEESSVINDSLSLNPIIHIDDLSEHSPIQVPNVGVDSN